VAGLKHRHGRRKHRALTTRHLFALAPHPVICAVCIPDGVAGPNGAGRLFLALCSRDRPVPILSGRFRSGRKGSACAVRNLSSPRSFCALRVGVYPERSRRALGSSLIFDSPGAASGTRIHEAGGNKRFQLSSISANFLRFNGLSRGKLPVDV
jgi:hypothetical protein